MSAAVDNIATVWRPVLLRDTPDGTHVHFDEMRAGTVAVSLVTGAVVTTRHLALGLVAAHGPLAVAAVDRTMRDLVPTHLANTAAAEHARSARKR